MPTRSNRFRYYNEPMPNAPPLPLNENMPNANENMPNASPLRRGRRPTRIVKKAPSINLRARHLQAVQQGRTRRLSQLRSRRATQPNISRSFNQPISRPRRVNKPAINIWSGIQNMVKPISESSKQKTIKSIINEFSRTGIRAPTTGGFIYNVPKSHYALMHPSAIIPNTKQLTNQQILGSTTNKFKFAWASLPDSRRQKIIDEMKGLYSVYNNTNKNRRNFNRSNLNPSTSIETITRFKNTLIKKGQKFANFNKSYTKWKTNKSDKQLFANMLKKWHAMNKPSTLLSHIDPFFKNYKQLINSAQLSKPVRNELSFKNSHARNVNHAMSVIKKGLGVIHYTSRIRKGLPV